MKKLAALLLSITLVCASPVQAKTSSPTNPMLSALEKQGAKMYYLGARSGLEGWFIVKDGHIQIAYVAPDGKNLLIGALFGEDGENVSAAQVTNIMTENPEIAKLLQAAADEQAAIDKVGTPPPSTSPAMSKPNSPSSPIAPTVIASPGERLLQDLGSASGVTLGSGNGPVIEMVMDPKCPHCQATWKALRDTVVKNSVRLRLIPVVAADTDNERAAGMLLQSSDPLTAWDKYVGGDEKSLTGKPSTATIAALHNNYIISDSWKINQTPYLVYRGKDGKVKILQGEPDKISALLTDLGVQ